LNNVLVLTYWSFPDALIQAYTLPYVRIIRNHLPPGSIIFLVTLEKDRRLLSGEQHGAIRRSLEAEGIHWVPFAYRRFGFSGFVLWLTAGTNLLFLVIRKKISTIHCWATPAGAIGYLLSVLTGRRLVLDSYEPHAEAMVENGTWTPSSLAFRMLFWLEKKQTERAAFIVSATAGMRQYAREKFGVSPQHFVVKPACVDVVLFGEGNVKSPARMRELGFTDHVVGVYAGKFGGIYLDEEVFDFFKVAYAFWGDRFRVLLLSSHSPDEINRFCRNAGLDPAIVSTRFVPHALVPDYMGVADFAVTPVKPVATKRYCTPIKDGEYWALGLPVVIPAFISDDSQIIEEEGIGAVLQDLTPGAYLEAVKKIDVLLQGSRTELFRKIRAIAVRYRSFELAQEAYRNVYDH
jgi:glycosyltransferase involved in cell wall biosynthesis